MIPSLPAFFDMIYTDKDGKLSKDGSMFQDQTFQVLNDIVQLVNFATTSLINNSQVSYNGLTPPILTTAEIGTLLPSVPNGTLFYNSQLNKLQFKSGAGGGSIETITSS